jgi:hypothetical protein
MARLFGLSFGGLEVEGVVKKAILFCRSASLF